MQTLRVGIGGPVGAGKTALTLLLCKAMRDNYDMAVVTNDIYTQEDAQFLTNHGALEKDRILGVTPTRAASPRLLRSRRLVNR